MLTNKRKIIITGLFVWFLIIIVVGYFLLQTKSNNTISSVEIKKDVNNKKVTELAYNKNKPLYNTDASIDFEYAKAIYGNQAGEFVLLKGRDEKLVNQINNNIKKLAKATATQSLLGWIIYYSNSGGEYLASAEYNIQTKQWDIFVNLAVAKENKRETAITLIHEFAHILSLNKKQVNYKIPLKLCLTHFIPEGCLKKKSYFYKFWKEFWQGNYSENELDVDGYAKKHYQRIPDEYVTEYAATNPAEDFAESFMFFITGDDFNSKRIASKKVNFFNQYSEFVRAKNTILREFKDILQ